MTFVGMAALHIAMLLPRPGGFGPTDPAQVAYLITVRALAGVAVIAMDAAVAISVIFAWYIGVGKPEVSEGARRGVLIFATVFLAGWLVTSLYLLSFLSFFFFIR